MRRYAVIALTNLTFGNADIKSFLSSSPAFLQVLVGQLEWDSLRKVTAHLFRNLGWKTDRRGKQSLSESGVVRVLMVAAQKVDSEVGGEGTCGRDEPTLKVLLSALWNLSAHGRKNKVSERKAASCSSKK